MFDKDDSETASNDENDVNKRLSNTLMKMTNRKLSKIDKRLLKGIYQNKIL